MRRFLLTLLVILFPLAADAQRLPGTVIPHHYELFFAPDLQTFTFDGRAEIDVAVNEPTRSILIHALELELERVTIESAGETIAASVVPRTAEEMVELRLDRTIQPGPARIDIDYRGSINDKLRGFYRGVFPDGKPYAATQLQSTSARQMFPSFDEPAMKATFAISAEVADGLMVISNSPVEAESRPSDGRTLFRFATTPRIPTYLVALVVGEFAAIEDELNGIPLRIIAAPDKIAMGQYAMDATKFILAWMQEYYGIPYPFAKLDQIAIPDFQAGAMENSGAIIYRETALLADSVSASEATRRYVASVIAHEIAHQWFGDLVTMEWWDDVWLNEGFASFMEDKPLEEWRPEWDIPTRIVAGMSWALNSDSLSTTRAIRSRAETSAEIDQMFDGISYSKGSALLRMIEAWVGRETFRNGVRSYLRRHAWRNTSSADLAEALTEESDLPVDRVLNDYVSITGIPLITAISACEAGETRIHLRQRRFIAEADAMRSNDETVWSIPVCMETSAGRQCVLFDAPAETFTVPGCGPVWLNDEGSGYYVTRYSQEALESLASTEGFLSPAERLVLLRDLWLQVRADTFGVDQYLDLITLFRDDRHRAVLSEILSRLETIDSELVADSQRSVWEKWLQDWLAPLVSELGWEPADDESPEIRSLRASVLDTMAGAAADPQSRTVARRMAEAWLENPAAIDPELTSTVLTAAARNGNRELFDAYSRALNATDNPSHRSSLLFARAQFPMASAHEQLLEEIFAGKVRNQDIDRLLRSLVSNPAARQMTWNAIRTRWRELAGLVPETDLPRIAASASVLCSASALREMNELVASNESISRSRQLRQARQRIEACQEFRELHASSLSEWLKERSK